MIETKVNYPYLREFPTGEGTVWFPEGVSTKIAKMRRGKYVRLPYDNRAVPHLYYETRRSVHQGICGIV